MSSSSPGRPRSLNRLSQNRTVASHRPILAAISGALRPCSTACRTICARRTRPAPSVRERAIRASWSASSSPNGRTRRVMAVLPNRTRPCLNAPRTKKPQTTCRMHHLAVWWLVTLWGSLGIFVAADLVTFYLAFAAVSLAAFGLIVQDGTARARRAGEITLLLAVMGEICLLLAFALLADAVDGPSLAVADALAALPGSPARGLIV